MTCERKQARSRSRDEWLELVKAGKANGPGTASLAAEHGLKATACRRGRGNLRVGAVDSSTGRRNLVTIDKRRLLAQAPVDAAFSRL